MTVPAPAVHVPEGRKQSSTEVCPDWPVCPSAIPHGVAAHRLLRFSALSRSVSLTVPTLLHQAQPHNDMDTPSATAIDAELRQLEFG